MTEHDIETLWKTQPEIVVSDDDTRRWMHQVRRARVLSPGMLVVLGIALVALLLRVSLLFTDSGHTWGNSSLDLLLAAVPIAAVAVQLRGRLRQRREVRALEHDTRAYVSYLIERTRTDLRESRRGVPVAMVAILATVGLAKWQSIAGGRESVDNALGGWALALVACVVGVTAVYHWTTAFVEPRLASLEEVRRSIDA